VAFSPDGSQVAVADSSSGWSLFDVSDGSSQSFSTSDSAYDVAFSPDGSQVAVADNNDGWSLLYF